MLRCSKLVLLYCVTYFSTVIVLMLIFLLIMWQEAHPACESLATAVLKRENSKLVNTKTESCIIYIVLITVFR